MDQVNIKKIPYTRLRTMYEIEINDHIYIWMHGNDLRPKIEVKAYSERLDVYCDPEDIGDAASLKEFVTKAKIDSLTRKDPFENV